MNQSLGFTFGAFKGFFIIMTILWFIALLPKQKWTSFMGKKSNILIIGCEGDTDKNLYNKLYKIGNQRLKKYD